jgi:hypothetical protein
LRVRVDGLVSQAQAGGRRRAARLPESTRQANLIFFFAWFVLFVYFVINPLNNTMT